MIARAFGVVVALSTVVGQPVASGEPLQPTGKWLAEFADNECVLSRSYGTPDHAQTLAFKRSPMETDMQVILLLESKRQDRDHGPAQVVFGQQSFAGNYGGDYSGAKSLRRLTIDLDEVSPGAPETASLVKVDIPGEAQKTFSVPGFRTALHILDQCVEDLGIEWGFSAEAQHRLAEPAKAVRELQGVFSPNDYPSDAVKDDASGRVRVGLLIDQSGRIAKCKILVASGHSSLDETTCRILKLRARFRPAKDIDGKPIPGAVTQTIDWLLI